MHHEFRVIDDLLIGTRGPRAERLPEGFGVPQQNPAQHGVVQAAPQDIRRPGVSVLW